MVAVCEVKRDAVVRVHSVFGHGLDRCRLGMHLLDVFRARMAAGVVPTVEYVGQDAGDLVVTRLCYRRHDGVVFLAVDLDLAVQAM